MSADEGDGNLCGEQFPSKKAFRAHQLWPSSLAGETRIGRCSVGGCAVFVVSIPVHSVGSTRQHVHKAYEMGHCRVDGGTHRWLHGRNARYANGLDFTGRRIELMQTIAIYLNQFLHPCHKGNHGHMPGLLPVSADSQHGAQRPLFGHLGRDVVERSVEGRRQRCSAASSSC